MTIAQLVRSIGFAYARWIHPASARAVDSAESRKYFLNSRLRDYSKWIEQQ